MATNGSKTVLVESALGAKTYLTFTWVFVSTSLEDNTSTIQWTCKFWSENNGFYPGGFEPYKVVVDGQTYEGTVQTALDMNESKNLITGRTTIPHNPDGTKTFSYSYSQTLSLRVGGTTVGIIGTDTLDQISRIAKVIGTENFNDEENPSITFTPAIGASKVEACISFTGVKDDVPYREIENSGSYTFELTDTERTALRAGFYDRTIRTVRMYLRTTINGAQSWHYQDAVVSLINHEPQLNPVVKDVNEYTKTLTGSENILIKHFSTAEVKSNAAAVKGALIGHQTVINGSHTVNSGNTTIEKVDSNTFYFSATDTRGTTVKDFVVFNGGDWIPYVKLTASLETDLLLANGNLTFTIKGKYFNESFGKEFNTLDVEYAIRDDSGSYFSTNESGWERLINVSPEVDAEYNYTFSHTITGLDYNSAYVLTVNVVDALTPVQSMSKVVAAVPIFDWGKDDFRFNTKVELTNGRHIYGTRPDGTKVVALETCNSGGNTCLGWGNYDIGQGTTNIYGNTIGLVSKGNITINGRIYGANQILWNGGSNGNPMYGGTTISLAQGISAQPNGVVLVFSLMKGETVTDDVSINTFFISKKEVELFPGKPHTFLMGINAGFSVIGAKYLYISNTSITGHSGNSGSGTNSGITYNNARFVLRYVIGV